MTSLEEAIASVASAPRLLVALDYDGTLAEIVDRPSEAVPVTGAVAAVEALTVLPGTRVALVSGRLLRELRDLAGAGDGVVLVGSHGAELGAAGEEHPGIPPLVERVADVVRRHPSVRVERKPATVTVHTRGLGEAEAERVAEEVRAIGAALGHRVEEGKRVVEVHVSGDTKGTALRRLRAAWGADAVVYVGDDTTDEEAFAVLEPGDVGVKVGGGETRAPHRVAGPDEVVDLLRRLAGLRGTAGREGPSRLREDPR